MAVSYKVIGGHVRRAREHARITQEEMAEALGISSAHYGRIERGTRTPTLEMLDRIARVLNKSFMEFLIGSDSNEETVLRNNRPNDYSSRFDALIQGCPDTAAEMVLEVCRTVTEFMKS